ncbi:MAG: cobaltochelatase subunit CobN, partial [Rhodospirillales bacterium]
FQATARCVADHHFDAVYDAYLADGSVRAFLENANPAALKEMADRLLEAERRGLWRPRLNSAHKVLAALAGTGPNALKKKPSMADAAGDSPRDAP